MVTKFINREEEMKFLEERFKRNNAELIIVYGRRRVGKTELLLQFAKDKPHIYFLASETSESDNLKELFGKLSAFFKDDILTLEKTWDNLFRYLAKKNRFILVLDEFPYLVSQNKAISSVFQRGWDLYLKKSNIFLVLSGSSIGMMEEHTLAYRAPLYGRRTGQWRVESLRFKELFKFFPAYSIEDIISVYGALGSIPAYIIKFDQQLSFWENIRQNNLKKGVFLYDEVDFLMKQELREPKIYKTILKSIALGNTKFSEIMNSTGIEKSKLFVYIDTLESLNIIGKRLPVLDKPKSKKGRYFIKDNFFKFWFRYILPNRSLIEEGNTGIVLENIRKDYSNYIGRFVFESVCQEFLRLFSAKLLFPIEKIGSQWGAFTDKKETKQYEIDIVALNEYRREILFAEAKWQENVNAKKILVELKEKAKHVMWNSQKRKEHYAIFAKSFKKRFKEPNLLLFDLSDLQRMLKSAG